MSYQTLLDHENRVYETLFIVENQVFETRDVSKIYTFETMSTNYIVRKMGLIPNFGHENAVKIIFLYLVPCKKKFKKYMNSFKYKQPKLKILTNLN